MPFEQALLTLAQAFSLLLPILLSGLFFIACMKKHWLMALNTPMDFGLELGGKRLFGPNKNWRGAVLYLVIEEFHDQDELKDGEQQGTFEEADRYEPCRNRERDDHVKLLFEGFFVPGRGLEAIPSIPKGLENPRDAPLGFHLFAVVFGV